MTKKKTFFLSFGQFGSQKKNKKYQFFYVSAELVFFLLFPTTDFYMLENLINCLKKLKQKKQLTME